YHPALDLRNEAIIDDGMHEMVSAFLPDETPDAAQAASPVAHISAMCPPVLTRVGDQDQLTPATVCAEFHRELTGLGVKNQLDIMAGTGHGVHLADPVGCLQMMKTFLSEHLGTAGGFVKTRSAT